MSLLYRMRDSLTLTRNSIAPLHGLQHNGGGGGNSGGVPGSALYSTSAASSRNASGFIGASNANYTTDSSAAAMDSSVLHDNLFLHPEVHNPVHLHSSNSGPYQRHSITQKSSNNNGHNGGGYGGGGTVSLFGQVKI